MPEINAANSGNSNSRRINDAEVLSLINSIQSQPSALPANDTDSYSGTVSNDAVKNPLRRGLNCLEGCRGQKKYNGNFPLDLDDLWTKTIDDLSPADLQAELRRITDNEDINHDFSKYFDPKFYRNKKSLLKDSIQLEQVKDSSLIVIDKAINSCRQDMDEHKYFGDSELMQVDQRIIDTLSRIKAEANGDDQKLIELARVENDKAKKRLQEQSAAYNYTGLSPYDLGVQYPLGRIEFDSYYEARERAYREELTHLDNPTVDYIVSSMDSLTISGINEKFLAYRALANLTGNPDYILYSCRKLRAEMAAGRVSKRELRRQIRRLARNVAGGYLGEGSNIPSEVVNPENDVQSPSDFSTRSLAAASWLVTKPDDKFSLSPQDDSLLFPKETYTINGKAGTKAEGFRRGRHYGKYIVMQNFKDPSDDIGTSVHEIIHHRDKSKILSNGSIDTSNSDGELPMFSHIKDFKQAHIAFGARIDRGIFSSVDIFVRSKSVVNKDLAELVAYTHEAFLTGNERFASAAKSLKLSKKPSDNFYNLLVRFYGVDPLSVPKEQWPVHLYDYSQSRLTR